MGFALCGPGQATLLSPDMRDWLPANHNVHRAAKAMERVPLSASHFIQYGAGSELYQPRAMLCQMLYGYSKRVFSSRRLEQEAKADRAAVYALCLIHELFGRRGLPRGHRALDGLQEGAADVLQILPDRRKAYIMGSRLTTHGTRYKDGTTPTASGSNDRTIADSRSPDRDREP